MQAAIPFPDISPEIFTLPLFGMELSLRWYALAYIVGILIGWRLVIGVMKSPRLWPGDTAPMTVKQVEDLLTWIVLGVILGGRLGFVLFYQPVYYFNNPAEILQVWQGACPFTVAFWGLSSAHTPFAIVTASRNNPQQMPLPSAHPQACCWAGSQISSMPNFGGNPQICPGAWPFPAHLHRIAPTSSVFVHGTHRNYMRPPLKGSCWGCSALPGLATRRAEISWDDQWGFPDRLRRIPVYRRIRTAGRCAIHHARQSNRICHTIPQHRPDHGTAAVFAHDRGRDYLYSGRTAQKQRRMSDLRQTLINRIQSNGPLPLSEFMDICLMHPEHGYYTTKDPFGAEGDFTTAPEISQMFGELVGLSLAQTWLDQGATAHFTLAEMGPGRGTMMADILRATRSVPGFHDAMQIILIEASDYLRARQKKTLSGYDITWLSTVDNLSDQPLFLIANEFFDALPIRQMQRDEKGWRERCVGLNEADLSLGLSPVTPFPALDHRLSDTKPGDIVEVSAATQAIAGKIGEKITHFGGVALIIDYGDWHSFRGHVSGAASTSDSRSADEPRHGGSDSTC